MPPKLVNEEVEDKWWLERSLIKLYSELKKTEGWQEIVMLIKDEIEDRLETLAQASCDERTATFMRGEISALRIVAAMPDKYIDSCESDMSKKKKNDR